MVKKKCLKPTYLCVEIMNSKRQVKGETWSSGKNSPLLSDANLTLNLSYQYLIEELLATLQSSFKCE